MRRCAWEIGARWPLGTVSETSRYVTLAPVAPTLALSTWNIDKAWLEQRSLERGEAWYGARLILRFYDVSFIEFNGFNAHRMFDVDLGHVRGETFVTFPHGGSSQIAEVGFLLRSGEFLPAARSATIALPSGAPSRRADSTCYFVDGALEPEVVATPWEGPAYVERRGKPKLRGGLRVAFLTFESAATGQSSMVGSFVTQLARQLARNHDVHVFLPSSSADDQDFDADGVHYRRLGPLSNGDPVHAAWAFARATEAKLLDEPPFDLFHLQEWMAALVPSSGTCPTVLSMSSLEVVRRNGAPASELSEVIAALEHEVAQVAGCVLVPGALRDTAVRELGLAAERVHAFPMEGRPENMWDCPLDLGRVKGDIGLGPFDRLATFVGPLCHESGVDLLVESLPSVLHRTDNARILLVGTGGLHDHLWNRAHQLGVSHALRTLGHVDGAQLAALLRASETLLLPSRQRVHGDEQVVGLARLAGIPVVATHTGPAQLVRHEESGLLTYDNPGSMVWALDRIYGAPEHASEMGRRAQCFQPGPPHWSRVAEIFSDLCAEKFAELAAST
jgi:glycosyltransferase involved in cell wall biosynthesis